MNTRAQLPSLVLDVPATGISVERAGKLEAYRPESAAGPLPAVVFVHGEEFLATAKAREAAVELIDVPDGHHGFDAVDDTDESRQAVADAMAAVGRHLHERSP
jgi:acetyl esterase/lipase